MSRWCWARRPIPAREPAGAAFSGSPEASDRGSNERRLICAPWEAVELFLRCQRAADESLTSTLGHFDELLAAGVLAALAGARMRAPGAIVLAGLADAVTLFSVGIIGREQRAREHEQAAYGGGEKGGFRGHITVLLVWVGLVDACNKATPVPSRETVQDQLVTVLSGRPHRRLWRQIRSRLRIRGAWAM